MHSERTIQTVPTLRRAASFPLLRRAAALLPLLVVAACGSDVPPTTPGGTAVAAVEVTAPALTMAVGATMQLGATPRSASGAAMTNVAVAWSSSNESVATVSGTGLVTANAPGLAVIRAAGGGKTGEATLTIAQPAVASLQITPGGEIELLASSGAQLSAVARSDAGIPIGGVPVTWASSDERVARVTAAGAVEARASGTAVVTAAAGGRTAQVTVRVRTLISFVIVRDNPGTSMQVGDTRQLGVRGVTATGDTVVRAAEWTSENEGVATVDATGRVTARRPGSALIRASMEGVPGRAMIVVAGTTVQQLESVGGQALPAQAGTRTFRDAQGVLHEQRVVVTGGTLRMGNGYEQRLTLEVYEGVRLSTEVYEDRGELWYNALTGHPVLRSTMRPGLEVATEAVMDDGYFTGELAVFQAVAGEGQKVTLCFGKP